MPSLKQKNGRTGNTELFSHLNEREHLSVISFQEKGHILEVLRMVFFFFIHSSHSVNNFCLFCLTYKTDFEHIESKNLISQFKLILFHHYPSANVFFRLPPLLLLHKLFRLISSSLFLFPRYCFYHFFFFF